jgi:hypothetical protein
MREVRTPIRWSEKEGTHILKSVEEERIQDTDRNGVSKRALTFY